MTVDCENERMLDLLPDFARGAVVAPEASTVRAHLDGCESCRAELLLLRTIREHCGGARAVDVASIVRALPAPSARVSHVGGRRDATVVDIASRRRARSIPALWRAAAAAAIVAAGSVGIAVSHHDVRSSTRHDVVAEAPIVVSPVVVTPETPTVRAPLRALPEPATAATAPAPALMLAVAARDLVAAKQKQLLEELEAYDGSVLADPETARYEFGGAGL